MEHDLLDEVVLLDEAGEPARFSHILTFLYEGERYIALSPLEEEASEEEAERAQRMLKEEMEAAISLEVPLIADVSVGKSWYDAK